MKQNLYAHVLDLQCEFPAHSTLKRPAPLGIKLFTPIFKLLQFHDSLPRPAFFGKKFLWYSNPKLLI